MVQGIIQLMLGEAGRALANFYTSFVVFINGPVLFYALIILWTHHNLRSLVREMETMMVEIANESNLDDMQGIYSQFCARWSERNHQKRYMLPTRRDLWWEPVKGKELIQLLHIDADYVRLALQMNTGKPEKQDFSPSVFLALQEYRHNLLVGLRSRLRDPNQMKAGHQPEEKPKHISRKLVTR